MGGGGSPCARRPMRPSSKEDLGTSPDSPVVKVKIALPLQGVWVWSPARELRSHMPHSKKKGGFRKKRERIWEEPGGKLKRQAGSRIKKCFLCREQGSTGASTEEDFRAARQTLSTEKSPYRISDRREIYVTPQRQPYVSGAGGREKKEESRI